ncbi:MAG: delta-60 repeat domain-containing protein [Candidatus Sulfotelmatobacter sp.]|jgi:uncharacterized delta-60 repeat protein
MSLAAGSKLVRLLVCCALLAVPSLLMAQAGSLDPTFGSSGIAATPGTTAAAAALQRDGKIVVAGGASNGSTVLRYNTNGTLDSTFGTGGQVILSASSAFAVAIQSDGKILVAAPDEFGSEFVLAIFRLNTNGSLDTSFGSKGVATITATTQFFAPANGTIALLAGGKILVVAQSASLGAEVFERLLSNGTPDSSFGTNGTAALVNAGQMLALQPGGEILVLAGLFPQGGAVSRYETNGSVDASFGGAGQAAGFGNGGAMAVIDSSSEFVVAGSLVTPPLSLQGNTTGFLLVRYKSNGNIDTTFGTNGVTTTPFPGNLFSAAAAVALQSNGDTVAGGSTAAAPNNPKNSDFALARYTASGTLDTTFGTNGLVTTTIGTDGSAINTLLIQSDGKILAFGNSSAGATIARYLSE